MPYGIGKHILRKLNKFGAFSNSVADDDAFVASRYKTWRKEQYESFSGRLVDDYGKPLTLGYVTKDVSSSVFLILEFGIKSSSTGSNALVDRATTPHIVPSQFSTLQAT